MVSNRRVLFLYKLEINRIERIYRFEDGAPAASVTPVINIIFQSDVVEEEVAEKLADLFHSGRTFYYTGGKVGKEAQEPPHFIRYKEVEWKDLEKINV